MALFGKKKEEKKVSCACNQANVEFEAVDACCGGKECKIEEIIVLGAGCKSCHEQLKNCENAVKELGMDIEVMYITDMEKVMAYGVMSMPGIVVNGNVVSMGKVLKAADVIKLLKKLGYC